MANKPEIRSPLRFSLRFFLVFVILIAIGVADISNKMRQTPPLPTTWDFSTGENIKWIIPLGSQTYCTPRIHKDKVFVGSNNGHGYDPAYRPSLDLGVMLCFDRTTGKFLWQHSNKKLAEGRVQDWPLQGISSRPFVDGDRLWYVSNRCEAVCLDTEGFYDNENDGVKSEKRTQPGSCEADVVWSVDMRKTFGVFPHNMSHCNVVVDSKRVYVKTSNGVDEAHLKLPSPNAPSFVVLDRNTGQTIWTDNTPKHVAHGSWGSPTLATIAGKEQILFPGGDGWLYSFEPAGDGKGNSVLLWKFDCNPKTAKYTLGGRLVGPGDGERNNPLTAPTVYEDKVYITLGQDPEHGEGQSRVWCIAPGKLRGDISPTIVTRSPTSPPISFENNFQHCNLSTGDVETPNPNSGLVWRYEGLDSNADGKVDFNDTPYMNRSLSEVQIHDDRAYVNDLFGNLHCIDALTGKYIWHYDFLSSTWNSPLVTDDHVYVGNEDGCVCVLATKPTATANLPILVAENPTPGFNSVYASPVSEKGVLYLVTRNELIAIQKDR